MHPPGTSPRSGPTGRIVKPVAAAALTMQTAACARGAPSLVFFGAYFPVWLACSVIGVAAAGAARLLMVLSGLSQWLPYPMLLCTAIGAAAGILAGLLWSGL